MKNISDFPESDAWFTFHVSYGETDNAGIVYYANYLHWFERARGKYIRDRGMSYAEVENRGIILPVRNANCRYIKPARYDDECHVRCAISKWSRASMTFVYQVWGPPGRETILATGETEHAAVNKDGRPVRIPDWLRELFS